MSEEKEESKEERAKVLFEKGQASFEQSNFLESLHYFKLSFKLKRNPETEEKIKQCEDKVNEIREKEKEEEQKNESNNNNENKTNEDDEECEKVINNNNYYDILGVSKDANNEEMKKAYKKLAIKFHPDKNHSSKAEDAFKKIATAYQTLTDPKKREIFDKYGSEEEYREKIYQERKREFEEEEEEFDPYDVFDMFFRGVDPKEILRRRRQFARRQQQVKINPKLARIAPFLQIIPLLLLALNYYLPSLLETKELYVFTGAPEYPFERTTRHYKVKYYVGNEFNEKYPTKGEVREVEKEVENKYMEYLKSSCDERKKAQEDLKYKLVYYRKGSTYYNKIEEQIKKVDISICDKYEKYLKKVNKDKDILEDQ